MRWRLRSLPACAGAAVLLAVPATASATLVFVRKPLHPVLWVAQDNGSGVRRLTAGTDPRISPDGSSVVYLRISSGRSYTSEMMVVPTNGSAAPRRLASDWREPYVFAFSPDSSTIATVVGPQVGKQSLVTVDLATGVQRTIATGYFSGVSFSPEGTQLVYGRAASEHYPPRTDVYRAEVGGGAPVAITHDHRSLSPVWGPSGEIAFVKLLDAGHRKYGPKNEIYLMSSEGGEVRRLTHTNVASLLQGLTPTQFSASGNQLLAEFGGEDTSYAVTVNPQTGAEHRPAKGNVGYGFIGTALSADGKTILGTTGGFEPGPDHNVVTVPYGGGPLKILARNAYEPVWSG